MNVLAILLMIVLILLVLFLAVVLVWFMVGSIPSGETQVQKRVKRSSQMRKKGDAGRAESILYLTIKGNGWDYQSFLMEVRRNPSANIVNLAPRFNQLTRRLRLTTPDIEFTWVWPAFLELGEVFVAQGRYKKAGRLYYDLLGFIEDLSEKLNREFLVEARQVCYEGAGKAYAELGEFEQAVAYYGAAYVERIHLLKLRDFNITLQDEYPLKKHEQIASILQNVGRNEQEEDIYTLINSYARLDISSFDPVHAQRNVEALLRGISNGQAREREVAKMLLKGIMDKVGQDESDSAGGQQPAQARHGEQNKKADDSGKKEKKEPGDDIIYL
ncbi:MAG: tetratricopeptide repeat protein [Candidatus Alcyoniella australis]|nr:tetratricopeptide repeat protein [Candidatus Alcyoniella australis]